MTRPLLGLVCEVLDERVAAGSRDPLVEGFRAWLARDRSPLPQEEHVGLWRYQDVAIAGLCAARGAPSETFAAGMTWLTARPYFQLNRTPGLEADPLALFAIALGVRTADEAHRAWVQEFAGKAYHSDVDPWRRSLIQASAALVSDDGWGCVGPELSVALEPTGLTKVSEVTRETALATILSGYEHARDERAVVMRIALDRIVSSEAQVRYPPCGHRRQEVEKPPRVLISYAHESNEHRARVLALAQQLRADGVDAWIDRFVAPPKEGWSHWMEGQLEEADRIIVVCTPTYFGRATRNAVDGVGLGVSWEWHLIRKEVYETRGEGARIVPVFLDGENRGSTPAEVWDRPRHEVKRLDGPGYFSLLDDLFRRPEVTPPPVGAPRVRPASLTGASVQSDGIPLTTDLQTGQVERSRDGNACTSAYILQETSRRIMEEGERPLGTLHGPTESDARAFWRHGDGLATAVFHADGRLAGKCFVVRKGIGYAYRQNLAMVHEALGAPIGDEYLTRQGARSEFERGRLEWVQTADAVDIVVERDGAQLTLKTVKL